MRILHAIRSVKAEGGGVIEAVKQLCRAHHQEGHTLEILTLDSAEDISASEFPVPVRALGPAHGKFGFSRNLVPWIRNRASEFDAVIINGIWQYHSLGVWSGLRGLPTPFYVFPHGMLDPWFKKAYPLKHLKKWLYWPWSDYRVLRDARAVLFTCEEERLSARQSFWLYKCRERVVELGIATPTGDPAHQRSLFLRKFPQLDNKRLILFLGRIQEKKGCDLLLKAFARLLRESPRIVRQPRPFHLVMAGPNQSGWLPDLQALATRLNLAAHVTWTGMLSGDIKLGALYSANVFALPSHQENFGMAVAESLACSLPVLISNKVNIWREVEQDGAGFIANDDEEGTFQLLRRWMALEPREQDFYRLRAHKCFVNRFEIGRSAKALLSVLRTPA